jgi:hypothetical protein
MKYYSMFMIKKKCRFKICKFFYENIMLYILICEKCKLKLFSKYLNLIDTNIIISNNINYYIFNDKN